MGSFLQPDDLAPFATIDPGKAQAMIEDGEATAILAAPCLADLPWEDPKRGAVKAILRRAILRWNDAGTGAITQIGSGPFQQTTAQGTNTPRTLFWPSEIEQLQGLCASSKSGKAYAVDTAPGGNSHPGAGHAPWCGLHFGGTECTCGVWVVA